jgi:hypothetical protein
MKIFLIILLLLIFLGEWDESQLPFSALYKMVSLQIDLYLSKLGLASLVICWRGQFMRKN